MMPDEIPMTLNEACAEFFHGRITPSTLRAEARRGRLRMMRIGRTDFVTPAAVREMMTLCHVQQKAPASTSTPPKASGSSETGRSLDARAAALSIAEELKARSDNTSPKSSAQPPGKVIPLVLQSQRS